MNKDLSTNEKILRIDATITILEKGCTINWGGDFAKKGCWAFDEISSLEVAIGDEIESWVDSLEKRQKEGEANHG